MTAETDSAIKSDETGGHGLAPSPVRHIAWAVGQEWQTENNHVFRVESIRPDGVAMLAMIRPYKTQPCSQLKIPEGWILLSNGQEEVSRP